MNRQPIIRFNALRAKSSEQEVNKVFQDNLDNQPKFTPNQAVFVRNFGKGAKWIPGTVVRTVSPRNFEVQVEDILWKRHKDQLRSRIDNFYPMLRVKSRTRGTRTNGRVEPSNSGKVCSNTSPFTVTGGYACDWYSRYGQHAWGVTCITGCTCERFEAINVPPEQTEGRYPLREREPHHA